MTTRPLSSQVQAALHPSELPLAVALSGGADSTALLLACWQLWPQQVAAIHVNHGLQAAAGEFEAFCRAFCAQRGIPLHVAQLHIPSIAGQSPQDLARRARYQALADGVAALNAAHALAAPIRTIALAHHADDQAETLLLALTRGAGLPGLAAMPMRWQRKPSTEPHGEPHAELHTELQWVRPLLHTAGADLRHWLQSQGQDWVEDPTNAQTDYTRNKIRHLLLPALEQAFPAFRQTFARSCANIQQAQEILTEVAEQDLQATGIPPHIRALQQLPAARQANALRHWLRTQYNVAPQQRQLQQLQRQIQACTTRGHQIHLKVGNGHVQRQGGQLVWVK